MQSRTSKIVFTAIIAVAIVGGAFYLQLANQVTYSSEKYSFQYPENYTLETGDQLNILTVKGSNGKLEIFQMKDFGDRPWGFEGEETQEDVDLYAPKETLTVGTEDKKYDVWLYYSESDSTTQKELNTIFNSIVIK